MGGFPVRPGRERLLEVTPGRTIAVEAVVARLAEVAKAYDLRGLAYDRWRFKGLAKLLDEAGLTIPMQPWGQGFQDMAPAVDQFERAVLERRIAHGGHPVLRWNLSNCRIQHDPAGNRKIVKRRDRARVDGVVSLAMAIGLWARESGWPAEYDPGERNLVLSA